MSNSVGIRELRQQASAVLKRVQAGEVIEVTDHGHPIARIVPLARTQLEQLAAEGRATLGEGGLLAMLDQIGLPVPSVGRELPSKSLQDMRAEDRDRG